MAHGCIISSEMNRLDKMSAIHPPLKKKTYLQKSFQLPAASFAVVWSRCEMDYYILELRHSVYFLHVNSSAPAWWGETWRQVNRTDREDVVHVQWVFACPSLEMLVLWDKCSRTNGGGLGNVYEQERGVTEKEKKEIGTKGRTGLLREHQTALLRLSSCRTGFAHLPLPLRTRRDKTTSISLFFYFLWSLDLSRHLSIASVYHYVNLYTSPIEIINESFPSMREVEYTDYLFCVSRFLFKEG